MPVGLTIAVPQAPAGARGDEQITGVPVGTTPVGSGALGVVRNSQPAEVL